MSGLLAAMTTFVVGALLGAAIQRWGDRDRATHGHKVVIPEDDFAKQLLLQFEAIDQGFLGSLADQALGRRAKLQ